ncbi:MAG: hypothetical protein ACPHCI_03985 [Solirubrobacterales bacterium]
MNRRSHKTQHPEPHTDRSEWVIPVRVIGTLAVFVALIILFAAPASAATYSVYSCKGPSDESLPATDWTQLSTNLPLTSFDFSGTCDTGGLTVATKQSSFYSTGDSASLQFAAAPNTDIVGISLTRQLRVQYQGGGSGTYSTIVREQRANATVDTGCIAQSTNCSIGYPTPTSMGLTLNPADSVSMRIACTIPTCPQGNGDVDVRATLVSARVDLDDAHAPTVTSITGSLLSSVSEPGLRSVVVAASDVGGGIRRVSLAVDGGTPDVYETGGSCAEPFSSRVPCPLNLTSAFVVDTNQLAIGSHTVNVVVEDVAGTTTSYGPIPFTVLAASPAPPAVPQPPTGSGGQLLSNGAPAVERPIMSLAKTRIESKKSGTVTINGVLVAPGGAPIGGAALQPIETDIGDVDAVETALPATFTAADGSFSIPVRAAGAKRIRISFRPNPSAAETAVVSVLVRQELRLSVKRSRSKLKRRGRLTISGRLTGAGAATNDAPVEINARVGRSWRAVGVVETNSRGVYKWRYRFVSVRRTKTFKFRALVRRSAAWPWPTEVGRTIKVRVTR